ncbi:5976_t:CDS:2 [Entrophospora sp. SA101]|nr:5976_t:CDS:2 [Entrophospora sp. SA101]
MNSKNFKNIDNNNEAVVSEDAGGTDVMDYNNVGHVDDNNYNDDRISNALENNVDNLEVVVIDVTSFVDNNDDGIEGINASRVDDNNDHINIIQNGNNDHGGEGILVSWADDNYQINIIQNDNNNVVHEIDLSEDNNQFQPILQPEIIIIDDDEDDEKDNNTNASVVAVEGDTESLQIKCTICLDYPKDVSATSCGKLKNLNLRHHNNYDNNTVMIVINKLIGGDSG